MWLHNSTTQQPHTHTSPQPGSKQSCSQSTLNLHLHAYDMSKPTSYRCHMRQKSPKLRIRLGGWTRLRSPSACLGLRIPTSMVFAFDDLKICDCQAWFTAPSALDDNLLRLRHRARERTRKNFLTYAISVRPLLTRWHGCLSLCQVSDRHELRCSCKR